ncbi:hypothetical protein HK57_00580 [Aspergillus ustus]|uniref:Uncharacterized protein n=1 Tax=Aspergillus ustus TaxID=40382 RepID=A0A0C1E6D3_ASPUT|nr:hypothetical protein HK57_00580 [Aspergillus ustus]
MVEALRPSDGEFNKVLEESLNTWSSYLRHASQDKRLPRYIIDLPALVSQTPPFLGDGLIPAGETISFACDKSPGGTSLSVRGRSTWKTSTGACELPPIILPEKLLLGTGGRVTVRLSDDAPFSEWPGVEGLDGYDEGNYISVLYFAWAYILSARWVELHSRSPDHKGRINYKMQGISVAESQLHQRTDVEIYLGDASEEEVLWWRNILSPDDCWEATTAYNDHVYFSPWSVSAKEAGLLVAFKDSTIDMLWRTSIVPPSSAAALKYLERFCIHHRLYAQCSVALAGVLYISFPRGRGVSLPLPKQVPRSVRAKSDGADSNSIANLIKAHGEMLPRYMTLSCNIWGLHSLLQSTFFNPDIECNLVSAWLNPAFAVLNSVPPTDRITPVIVLANRQPRLGILWLGAFLVNVDQSVLRDTRNGMVALDLATSAWTNTPRTFLTSPMGSNDGTSISRDDECRLLFISSSECHERPPIWPWKPFGSTHLRDTELAVQEHARCAATHCLEYESWEWMLADGTTIRDLQKADDAQLYQQTSNSTSQQSTPGSKSTLPGDYDYNLSSQMLSELATRGIFGWLRSTGYPENEKAIYQHLWIDLGSTDEEETGEEMSDGKVGPDTNQLHVEAWLERIIEGSFAARE